ncbi:hypothetical protein DFH08DRAFT_838254 [Mycena albidolilacea]|uniref:Uncharacterized protein n=1 Tax=Mycena albidolilacea TaxID=1033008 RepID=A0AAD7ANT0_9AGAR|nr:hypothetical protein DFH08DRAFT_838254 [Mycena albidolilacea]
MFFKFQAVVFASSILSVSLGRPFESGSHLKRMHKPAIVRAQVVRAQVVQRDASATCATCSTVTVKVSGTATASAAFTFTFGGPAPTSTASPSTIANFGSCTTPQIEFGAGFDGRKETSFRPVDRVSYNHDSADIATITEFICNALINTCGADLLARATCAKARQAAAAETPEQGIDADAFNAVFGIQTNFKDVQAISDAGVPTSTISSATESSTNTAASQTSSSTDSATTSPAATSNTSPPASSSSHNAASTHETGATHASPTTLVTVAITTAEPTEPAPTSASGSTNSNNLQTFTGALGGVSAPAVVAAGNNQFQVEDNSLFNSKASALARSCDVQQNDCANAANASGNKGSFTVAACGTQKNDCKTASGA